MKAIRPQFSAFRRRLPETDRQSGFSLIEVLIAVSILSVGLLAIASMQIAAIQTNGKAKYVSEGSSWAEDRLEWLMSLNYSDPQLSSAGTFPDPDAAPAGYTIEYQVELDTPRPNCKRISVKVTSRERGINKVTIMRAVKPQL
ncbi:MAG: prepilin-type N-terminal cleavage/methylation domain-containing protein [Pseudomonadota bacterium]